MRKLWEHKISREKFKATKYSTVCIKHFQEEFIIRENVVITSTGEKIVFPNKKIKLKRGAYPTIVSDTVPHLNTKLGRKRKCREEKEDENYRQAIQNSCITYMQEEEENELETLEKLFHYCASCITSLPTAKDWIFQQRGDKLFIYKINTNNIPELELSIVISSDFSFLLYIYGREFLNSKLKKIGSVNSKHKFDKLLELTSELLLSGVNELSQHKLQLIFSDLTEIINLEDKKCTFVLEQLHLALLGKKLKYSQQLYKFSLRMYLTSFCGYKILRGFNILTLPHPRNLRKLASGLYHDSGNCNPTNDYLKKRISSLSSNDRFVNLLVDEIYLDPQLTFKGGKLIGASVEGSATDIAKTVLVFFLNSVCSSYKDVVALLPVSNLTSDKLYSFAINVIQELTAVGFKVVSIITDNNSINISLFSTFHKEHTNNNGNLMNPCCPGLPLFLFFDPVHILKNIRNNWINAKGLILDFPDMENLTVLRKANFIHLRFLYSLQRDSCLKFTPKLSNKAVYPSSLERQKVHLAIKIFLKKM